MLASPTSPELVKTLEKRKAGIHLSLIGRTLFPPGNLEE
jgi:hypothetical protein